MWQLPLSHFCTTPHHCFCTPGVNLHTNFNGPDLLRSRERAPDAFGVNWGVRLCLGWLSVQSALRRSTECQVAVSKDSKHPRVPDGIFPKNLGFTSHIEMVARTVNTTIQTVKPWTQLFLPSTQRKSAHQEAGSGRQEDHEVPSPLPPQVGPDTCSPTLTLNQTGAHTHAHKRTHQPSHTVLTLTRSGWFIVYKIPLSH